ncbi:ABC transporter substrate-binding protein [Mesorhizobium sp. WSM3224]|uniref:ABC transporter substrate-binding protein n=1 Tax=Mesorhizobium sp. WSM3224 TaxID=1040986 RepID=UPI000484056B|nr:ABC transporter substrate-binding protein [Mesorhizobium sp. WSM3224]
MRSSALSKKTLVIIGLVASTFVLTKPGAAADQITITSWGGALQRAESQAWFEPFSKTTGVAVNEDEYSGDAAKIQAMVETKSVTWDVVDGYSTWVNRLCDQGLLERIDWNKLGLNRSKFIDGDMYECGVPSVISSSVVAYDKDKLPDGPKTIADLFDTKKFPGKRGLEKTAAGNLEWALVADGVPVQDVYKVLNTPEGVDRAFKKLDTIKKDVIWWEAGAQPPQLLADGQVVMTAAYNGRIYDANKNSGKNFAIMWDAQLPGVGNVWVIPAGGPHLDDAYKFIAYAASPEVQGTLTKYIPYGPANKDAMEFVGGEVLPWLANAPEHMTNAIKTDTAFWNEKGDDLNQRFTAWLAQ